MNDQVLISIAERRLCGCAPCDRSGLMCTVECRRLRYRLNKAEYPAAHGILCILCDSHWYRQFNSGSGYVHGWSNTGPVDHLLRRGHWFGAARDTSRWPYRSVSYRLTLNFNFLAPVVSEIIGGPKFTSRGSFSVVAPEKAESTSVPTCCPSSKLPCPFGWRKPSVCCRTSERLDVGGAVPRPRDKGPRHCTGGGSRQATPRSSCWLMSINQEDARYG